MYPLGHEAWHYFPESLSTYLFESMSNKLYKGGSKITLNFPLEFWLQVSNFQVATKEEKENALSPLRLKMHTINEVTPTVAILRTFLFDLVQLSGKTLMMLKWDSCMLNLTGNNFTA